MSPMFVLNGVHESGSDMYMLGLSSLGWAWNRILSELMSS